MNLFNKNINFITNFNLKFAIHNSADEKLFSV